MIHKLTGRIPKISLTVVCLLLGIAVVSQLRTESRLRSTITLDSPADLAAIAGNLYDNNSALRAEVDKLVAERASGTPATADPGQAERLAELQRLQAFNGVVEVSGSGVLLRIDATIRPTDLLDLVNELRNAGAEAIAIGNQRVVYNSVVGGTQGKVTVNGATVVSPILVSAIGAPDVLDRALARKGGMLAYLRTTYPRATIELQTVNSLTLPAYAPRFGAPSST